MTSVIKRLVLFCATITLSNYPMQAPEAEEGGTDCTICLDQLNNGVPVMRLRCGHAFHQGCILGWLNDLHHTTCPICRTPVAAEPHEAKIPAYVPSIGEPHAQQLPCAGPSGHAAPAPAVHVESAHHAEPPHAVHAEPVHELAPAVLHDQPAPLVDRLLDSLKHHWQHWLTPRTRSRIITGLELAAATCLTVYAVRTRSHPIVFASTFLPALTTHIVPASIAAPTATRSIALATTASHLLYPHVTMDHIHAAAAGFAAGRWLGPLVVDLCALIE